MYKEINFAELNKPFEFEFGKYFESFECSYYYYGSNALEALFYDANKNVSVSLTEIFGFYAQKEKNAAHELCEDAPKAIKLFILEKLMNLTCNSIKPNELLNPLGGKRHYNFVPVDTSFNLWQEQHFMMLKIANPTFSNRKIYKNMSPVFLNENGVSSEVEFKGLRAIEKNIKLFETRRKRLKLVSNKLQRFYPLRKERDILSESLVTEKDVNKIKSIQFNLETIESKWQLLIKSLDEIYKNPATLI